MKSLLNYITEKLVINKNYKMYNYYPKNRSELKAIIIREHYIKKIYNLNDIDVSKITDFNSLFYGDNNTGNKDFDISEWNVSSGENFSWMFRGCAKFNCDLSSWDVSSGKNFSWMFTHCHEFNSDLSKWNISTDAYTCDMFYKCNIDNKFKPKGVQ